MKITAVKTFLLEHPLAHAAGPSTYYYRSRSALIVKLETDEGLVGWGETAPMPGVRAIIEQQSARVLVGQNPLDHRQLWRALWGPNFGNGMAVGGIDIALQDLRGKALGLPVAALYGGRLRERVPVYGSGMNYLEGLDPAETYPREATALVEQGYRALKMRIGGQPLSQDLAVVSAVRKAVGPDVKLMADGNGAYTLGAAIQMGRELEQLGLHWFEEPLPQPNYAGYEVLTDKLDIAIAAGEALDSRGAFREVITRRAMDIVQPDISLCGGFGEALFVAELARLWGISCTPHCWGGAIIIAATVQLLSLLPDASWARSSETPMLEFDLVESPFRSEFLNEPLDITGGYISVPSGPGLGIEIDESRLLHYAV
jgi:D-galactarolactone cycloisomerase